MITYHDSTAKNIVHIVKLDKRTIGKIERTNNGLYFYRANAGCRGSTYSTVEAVKKSIEG